MKITEEKLIWFESFLRAFKKPSREAFQAFTKELDDGEAHDQSRTESDEEPSRKNNHE